jgi:sigma-E factor negative regulatory protein RseA
MDKISALMDGELDAPQADLQLARLKQDAEARASWDSYHLIGAAMRGEPMMTPNLARRLSDRLAQEPTVLAPRPIAGRATTYALSAAASIAAVAVVGWVAFHNPIAPQPEVAAAIPAAEPAPAAQLASVPRDGTMNEYLMAHQGFSPSTAIQGLAPYVRTVSGTPAGE